MPTMRSQKRRRASHRRGARTKQTRKRMRIRGGGGRGGPTRGLSKGGQEGDSKAKSFKKLTCSPLSTEYKNGNPISKHETCLPKEEIFRAKNNWNAANPSKLITYKTPNKIWKTIQDNLKGVCSDDLCILNQPFMKNTGTSVTESVSGASPSESGGKDHKINLNDYYAPKMPKEWKKNPTEWLSNIEILEKMKQYEEAYPCFEFIGPTTIDFDAVLSDNKCVESELCHFQLADYIKNGTKKIGIIFNTDPHDKGGSHWISLFINIPKKMIFFFDSAGDEAPKEIVTFVERVKNQGLSLQPPIKFKFDQNYPNEHQYSTTECGMYSLYFIINMLEDKLTANYLKTHIIPDQQMIDYRKKYFNDI